jgi:hypothetical protein
MAKNYAVDGDQEATIENALDALDEDPDEPDVDRTRGRSGAGEISTGEALARIAAAYTGWSA